MMSYQFPFLGKGLMPQVLGKGVLKYKLRNAGQWITERVVTSKFSFIPLHQADSTSTRCLYMKNGSLIYLDRKEAEKQRILMLFKG